MSENPISSSFRKLAGIPLTARSLREEKVDISENDILMLLSSSIDFYGPVEYRGGESDGPSRFDVGRSCCDALVRIGYDSVKVDKIRNLIDRLEDVRDAREAATQAFSSFAKKMYY